MNDNNLIDEKVAKEIIDYTIDKQNEIFFEEIRKKDNIIKKLIWTIVFLTISWTWGIMFIAKFI